MKNNESLVKGGCGEELEEQACEKALEYYARKAEHMRYSNPLLDEYNRRSRMYRGVFISRN